MKQYYTRYLPIGDAKSVEVDTSRLWVSGDTMMDGNGKYWRYIDQTTIIQLVLFLCTGIIEISDVFFEDGSTEERKADSWEVAKAATMNSGMYKIVGRISPEALWIEEYMTLTEDDIEKGGGYILYYNKKLTFWTKDNTIDDYKECQYIKMKCPSCKTFH